MNRLFIFDVDGTLTPSSQRMTEDFAKYFDEWSSKNNYYLVTSGDLEKTREQVPLLYLERAQGIFTCCGNIFYKNRIIDLDGEREIHTSKIYENILEQSEKLNLNEIGLDKSQILRHISDDFDGLTDEYIFIGDRTMEGGNDYSLAQLINQKGNGTSYQTKNPENTKKILELING